MNDQKSDKRSATSVSRRMARMLARIEARTKERLEGLGVGVTREVWKFVAGGATREERERRAEVAIYTRTRLGCQARTWPKLWKVVHLWRADTAACAARRSRGLGRPSIEQTCEGIELPPRRPPPRRATKSARKATELAVLIADQERITQRLRALEEGRA